MHLRQDAPFFQCVVVTPIPHSRPAPLYELPAHAESTPCRPPSHIIVPMADRAAFSSALIGIRILAGGDIISSVSTGKYIKKEIKANGVYQNTIMRSSAPTTKNRLPEPHIRAHLGPASSSFVLRHDAI